jgi:hypothetical protein
LEELRIRVEVKEDGTIEIAFPNADIIETEQGPMMGFRCSPDAAMYAGGSIVHAAFTAMGHVVDDESEEEEDEDDE